MQRLFVALEIPDAVARHMMLLQSGIPDARWQSREQLHLTLRFLGEVDNRDVATVDEALAAIDAPGFTLEPHGVGEFGGKKPDAIWAGVRPNAALSHLQRKVETAVQRTGQKLDHQTYKPHITLARLARGTQPGRVMDWLTDHALFAAAPFAVTQFALYTSVLTGDGSVYRVEQAYPLR